jgi:hypothetical protein
MQRFDIINRFIKKFNFNNYLEIGVYTGECIRQVIANHKDAVDPGNEGHIASEVNYPITSDAFFELIRGNNDIKYDIIFIDGLHHSEQVNKDIENALNHIVDGGVIVLHDCNPEKEEYTTVPRTTGIWHGDVYKSILSFRKDNKHTVFTIDTDCGCGVIINDNSGKTYCDVDSLQKGIESWDYFDKNRKNLLNLISVYDFTANY